MLAALLLFSLVTVNYAVAQENHVATNTNQTSSKAAHQEDNWITQFFLPATIKPFLSRPMGKLEMKSPWVTALHPNAYPMPPHLMRFRVYFHCRGRQKRYEMLSYPHVYLDHAPFSPKKMTFFLIHGFQNTGEEQWLTDMKDALLNRTDANVMIGEWGPGAKVLSYIQAVTNTRVAGLQFTSFINHLIDYKNLNVTLFHCIGHSLGAQICSMIGKSIPGIFQITGLDPAQPLYNDKVADPLLRLGKNDSNFVVAIHSDSHVFMPRVGFGYMREMGHVDFFLNSGYGQPMCAFPSIIAVPTFINIFDFMTPAYVQFFEILLCPHQKAVDVLIQAINERECIFWGRAVTMANMARAATNSKWVGFAAPFLAADEEECNMNNCSPLGLDTYFWPARGTFTVVTRSGTKFCIDHVMPLKDQRNFATHTLRWVTDFGDHYGGYSTGDEMTDSNNKTNGSAFKLFKSKSSLLRRLLTKLAKT